MNEMNTDRPPMLEHKSFVRVAGVVGLILLIPLVAMQFSDDVVWSWFDFAAMGVLLGGTGLMLELVVRNVRDTRYRLAIAGAIVLTLLVVWVQLSAGIID